MAAQSHVPAAPDRSREMFRCDDLRARLLRLTCAKQHIARANPTCERCKSGVGPEHAAEFGLIKLRKRKEPEHKVQNKKCVRCGIRFRTTDGRAYHCEDCRTPKARIKEACERATNTLRSAGHRVDMNMTPNGAVLVYSGKPDQAEEALRLLVDCGYAVRITAVCAGSALQVIDAVQSSSPQTIKLAIHEQRIRRYAPPPKHVREDESEQFSLFDDE